MCLCCSKNNEWDWTAKENFADGFSLNENCELIIYNASGGKFSGALQMNSSAVDNPDGSYSTLSLDIELSDIPYRITGSKVHIAGLEIPGTIKFDKWLSNLCKAETDEMAGTLFFQTEMSWSGSGPVLYAGSVLNGEWVIRFLADNGQRFLFRCKAVSLKNGI